MQKHWYSPTTRLSDSRAGNALYLSLQPLSKHSAWHRIFTEKLVAQLIPIRAYIKGKKEGRKEAGKIGRKEGRKETSIGETMEKLAPLYTIDGVVK